MGILGGFSGTVGTVVGSTTRKGDDLIRVKSKKKRTTNSEGQVNQQTKFSLVTTFLTCVNFLLKIGFRGIAGNLMSPYNYAAKLALNNAITGIAPDFELDFSKVQISEGALAREVVASAELVAGEINFQWGDSTGNGNCTSTDKAVLLVYNVDKGEFSYSVGAVTRASKVGILNLPYQEVGDRLLFYLFFQSATDALQVSSSQFLGSATVAE